MNKTFPKAEEIIEISNDIINKWHGEEANISSFDAMKILNYNNQDNILHHIEILSLINTIQWHEEDKARDNDSLDSVIVETKRKIDKSNDKRVNKIEEIDEILFEKIYFNEEAPVNTESLGSVIDRLTILALKQNHMSYEANRNDSTKEQRNKCQEKLFMINKQMDDLIKAYNYLIMEIEMGKRRFVIYKQFKMYNDLDLNPVLYKKKVKN